MSENQQVVYIYDGSFEGFLCCVYHFYYNRLKPVRIVSQRQYTPSFYENYIVDTDYEQVYKVRFAIEEKMGYRNLAFINDCFITCLPDREMHMLKYIVKGFRVGSRIIDMITDEDVAALRKAHRHLEREKEKYLGIIRFYKAGDIYVSKIEPKNQILPLITWHFTNRFADQQFIIYDATNKQALIYSNKNYKIIYVEDIELPQMDRDERYKRQLWKHFYDTVAIKERYNPRCRMSFMPKRMWNNLPEMQEGGYLPEKT